MAKAPQKIVLAGSRDIPFDRLSLSQSNVRRVRDLFQPDDGGWLTDPALLDRLVAEKLQAEGERIGAEGWKWVATAVDMPWGVTNGMRELDGVETPMTPEEAETVEKLQAEADALESEWMDAADVPDEVHARLTALDEGIGAIVDRPKTFDSEEMARAGVFVSIERDGSLCIERGYVRPEDEPEAEIEAVGAAEAPDGDNVGTGGEDEDVVGSTGSNVVPIGAASGDDDDEDGEVVKPLPDRLVAELTAWRTLALQDAFAQNPSTAFATVLHAFVLDCFYHSSRESCLEVSLRKVSFGFAPAGLRDSTPAKTLAERHKRWADRLPDSDKEVWDALLQFDGAEQAALFAHCASIAVNAQQEVVPKYDNGRISKHSVERRIAHSHVLARAVGLDLIGAGWRATVPGYFTSVTKPRIIADVAEAKGAKFAEMIDHLKKADMAREAERLLEDSDWLPEPIRDRFVGRERRYLYRPYLESLAATTISTTAPLMLVDLTGGGAYDMGVDTDAKGSRAHVAGQAFAEALHGRTAADGIIFDSRLTGAPCAAIFDRAFARLQASPPVDLLRVAALTDELKARDIIVRRRRISSV